MSELPLRQLRWAAAPLEVAGAGPLAMKLAASLVCERCTLPEITEDGERIGGAAPGAGSRSRQAESLDGLSTRFSDAAIETAVEWSRGGVPDADALRPRRLPARRARAPRAAARRLQSGGVRWFSAGDPDARETAIAEKGSGAAFVLADVDQATLLKQAMSEVFTIVTHRQRQQLPLLVTSSSLGRGSSPASRGRRTWSGACARAGRKRSTSSRRRGR